MTDVEAAVARLQEKALDQSQRLKTAVDNSKEYSAKLEVLEKEAQVFNEAREFLLAISKSMRKKVTGDIESVVTSALRSVFLDPHMAFSIRLEEKRGQMEASFLVRERTQGGWHEEDPMRSNGGSLVDVIEAGLRIVLLKQMRPTRRQILFLDEPGKSLSKEKRLRYVQWLRQVCDKLEIQIIVITHDDEVEAVADKVLMLKHSKKGVVVEERRPRKTLEGYGTV